MTGQAEPGSTITVELPDGSTIDGVTDDDGNFEVTLPGGTELAPGDEIIVVATDEAGNASDPTTVVVSEAPNTTAPIITPIPDGSAEENEPMDDIVIETDEPSDIVVEGLPDGVEYDPDRGVIGGTPVVNDWRDGETEREFTVTVTATDDAGNVSTLEFTLVI